MQNNIPAVLSVMKFIYENIMYAELNTKSDYCEACGYDGEIKIVEDESGKLVWECPNCGNRDQNRLSVARRTVVTSVHSSGIRAEHRKSVIGCCMFPAIPFLRIEVCLVYRRTGIPGFKCVDH